MCVYILPCTLYIMQYTQLYMVNTLLTWYLPRPTHALTSTFSNQARLSLHRILHPEASSPTWLEYVYRKAHPTLRWLPTKLAEWIGVNLQDELGFPDKADRLSEPGSGWTPAELNHILQAHVVDGALTSFGCVEWESELFRGTMRSRCYPFDMPKRRFHSFNPKVCQPSCNISYQYIT